MEKIYFILFLMIVFFRILPQNIGSYKDIYGRLFVKIYEYQKKPYEFKTFGMELHDYINKDYVTKQEIIEIKKK